MPFNLDDLTNIVNSLKDGGATKSLAPDDRSAAYAPQPQPLANPQLDLSSAQAVPTINNPPHGMFGIHGVPRDILGLLGDAFLVQSGNKPEYGPKLQQERESKAMDGFIDNPLAAAQRLATEGANPTAARDFYEHVNDQKTRQRAADQTYEDTVLGRAYSMINSANEGNYPQVKSQVLSYLAAKGVALPGGMKLPDAYDAGALRGLATSGVPVDKQIDDAAMAAWRQSQMGYKGKALDERSQYHQGVLKQTDRRLDQGEDRITETGRHNQATEGIYQDRNDETGRHNKASESNTTRGQDIRDRRAERTTAKTIASRVRNSRGEVVVTYKDGTVQTLHDSRPLSGKMNRSNGPAAAAAPVAVKNRAEALALKPGTAFVTPDGKHFVR